MKTFLSLKIVFVVSVTKLYFPYTVTNQTNHPSLLSRTLQPKEFSSIKWTRLNTDRRKTCQKKQQQQQQRLQRSRMTRNRAQSTCRP